MPGPVDEKQWRRVRFTASPLVDHLEHESDSLCGEAIDGIRAQMGSLRCR